MANRRDHGRGTPATRVVEPQPRTMRPLTPCGDAVASVAWQRAMDATDTTQDVLASVLHCTQQNVSARVARGTIVAEIGRLLAHPASRACALRFVHVELPACVPDRRTSQRDRALAEAMRRAAELHEAEMRQRRGA